jgi:hypothetical protein
MQDQPQVIIVSWKFLSIYSIRFTVPAAKEKRIKTPAIAMFTNDALRPDLSGGRVFFGLTK